MTTGTRARLLVPHRSPHHAEVSGYSQLVRHVAGGVAVQHSWGPHRVRRALARRAGSALYGATSAGKEIAAIGTALRLGAEVVHLLHGERDAFLTALAPRRRPWRLVASFHKPADQLDAIVNKRTLGRVDLAIALNTNQVEWLETVVGRDAVEVVPHGVDTEFFVPATKARQSRPMALFVGQHMRDFKTFRAAATALSHCGVHVVAVVHESYRAEIGDVSGIRVHSDISDEALREFYQEATVLLLPLLDATACNSILEALACGLPVVSTNLPGMSDYVADGEGGRLCEPASADELITQVLALVDSSTIEYERSCEAARSQALRFSWPTIARKIETLYTRLER